jgi:hypothetical protein
MMQDAMTVRVLDKQKWGDLARAIAASGFQLYGPVLDEDELRLAELTELRELDFGYSNFKMSPKEFFFPQSEVLCRFCREELISDAVAEEEKKVLLGIRPCDARALWLMDKVFLQEPADVYYKQKRESTLVISAACTDPESRCFCTSLGGSPAGTEGTDVIAFNLGESILLEPVTTKGEGFLNQFAELTREASREEVSQRERIAQGASSRMKKISLDEIAERFAKSFDSDMWRVPSLKCLGCGICTYFCPTCHCFDVTDETLKGNGQRVRTWDSCMYSLFTLHASGHNPRPTQKERVRQRFMHKFSYSVENYGEVFCVGCGRCIKHCPVNLDLREVIAP